jgi:trans-aconitate methyltransferase
MNIYQYKSYEHYVQAQINGNLQKEGTVWVKPETIETIVKQHDREVNAVLCHGTRAGRELNCFKRHYPNAEVVGTEISPNATNYPMTVQWDFNLPKEEWVRKFDIVYSNSFDHVFNPFGTFEVWSNQLSENGTLYVEIPTRIHNNTSTEMDPLEISIEEFEQLVDFFDMEVVCKLDAWGGVSRTNYTIIVGCRHK